jgi:hypothetical protein
MSVFLRGLDGKHGATSFALITRRPVCLNPFVELESRNGSKLELFRGVTLTSVVSCREGEKKQFRMSTCP